MPMPKTISEKPDRAKVLAKSPDVRVDREGNVILGYVVAQEGDFKSEGRGSFDLKALKSIVTLMNKNGPKGTRSRFTHPGLSSDGLGTFLGRAKNPRLDSVRLKRDGEHLLLNAVRADLYLDPSSFDTPNGNLGKYVLDLAESDSDALSSSLVLSADEEEQLDPKTKRPLLDEKGNPKPPLWRPTRIFASDVVDTGDAVDGFLSATLSIEGLADADVRVATAVLNRAFSGCDRATVKARAESFLAKYLDMTFGDEGEESVDSSAAEDRPAGLSLAKAKRLAERMAM